MSLRRTTGQVHRVPQSGFKTRSGKVSDDNGEDPVASDGDKDQLGSRPGLEDEPHTPFTTNSSGSTVGIGNLDGPNQVLALTRAVHLRQAPVQGLDMFDQLQPSHDNLTEAIQYAARWIVNNSGGPGQRLSISYQERWSGVLDDMVKMVQIPEQRTVNGVTFEMEGAAQAGSSMEELKLMLYDAWKAMEYAVRDDEVMNHVGISGAGRNRNNEIQVSDVGAKRQFDTDQPAR